MVQKDLASVEYWDQQYVCISHAGGGWRPSDYNSLVLEQILLKGVRKCGVAPRSILEIGCGASPWLPYLASRTMANVAGIDYSEPGCKRAREGLKAAGVPGTIYHEDLFTADPVRIGTYDFVYSLGVVEHFSDLEGVISSMSRFVNPGGVMLAEIPNLYSFHGFLGWLWQPRVMAQHRCISKKRLHRGFCAAGFAGVEGRYAGLFSLNMVAWGIDPRWPRLERAFLPRIQQLVAWSDRLLIKAGGLDRSMPYTSPFLYMVGRKS